MSGKFSGEPKATAPTWFLCLSLVVCMAIHRFRRRLLIAAAAVGGIIALWWAMTPRDDPRLYGRWRIGGMSSFQITLEPGGHGISNLLGSPTELSWRIDDGCLCLEYLRPTFVERMRSRLDRLWGESGNVIKYSIVEIQPDVVLMKSHKGSNVRMTRVNPPATYRDGTRVEESRAE